MKYCSILHGRVCVMYLKLKQMGRKLSKRCRWNGKQCRPWSDCSSRSSLIWVYTVCQGFFVRKLRIITVIELLVQTYWIGDLIWRLTKPYLMTLKALLSWPQFTKLFSCSSQLSLKFIMLLHLLVSWISKWLDNESMYIYLNPTISVIMCS